MILRGAQPNPTDYLGAAYQLFFPFASFAQFADNPIDWRAGRPRSYFSTGALRRV